MNRNDNIKDKYLRLDTIPEKGYLDCDKSSLEEKIIRDSINAAKDSLSMYKQGSTTKPGTIPHELPLYVQQIVQKMSNPNAVDREMFRGAANREKDVLSMTSRLFGKVDGDELDAGYLLSGGSESLNQIAYMLRNKYFMQTLGQNVRHTGLAKAIINATLTRQKNGQNNHSNVITPRILLPVNYHFCGIKGADLLGLGNDSLAFYDLDNNFDVDEVSLENTVKEIYDSGDDIIYNLTVAGDTSHGKVHDIKRISTIVNKISKEYNKKSPPIIIDAAGSYMFIGVMRNNPQYDGILPEVSFTIPNVEAIVADPHKQPIPYSCGMLMLKDMDNVRYTDMRALSNPSYLDMDDSDSKDISAALATIPTSRSGSNAFALWAYMAFQGMSGLKAEKERIWNLVKDFRDYVASNENLELVCEPQTQIVSFMYKGTGEENIEIYKNIKNNSLDSCYISKDEGMLVKTSKQRERVNSGSLDYSGLFVTIMEHNTQKHMDKLKKRIDELVKTPVYFNRE